MIDSIIDLKTICPCGPLTEHLENWKLVLKKINLYDLSYEPYEIAYQCAYLKEKETFFHDYSVVFFENYSPIGVWPICVYHRNDNYILGSNNKNCLFPIVIDPLRNTKAHKKINQYCFQILQALCIHYGIEEFAFEENFHLYKINCFYEKLITSGARVSFLRHELYADLSLGYDALHQNMRKSYKSLINNGMKHLKCEIVNGNSENLTDSVNAFCSLHVAVSGRETRGEETWRLQEMALRQSDGFIVMIKDLNDVLIGASLNMTSRNTGSYSVGAYERTLFDQYALGHIGQIIALERLCQLNKKWYYLGSMLLSQDQPAPTPKEITIGNFKKGFATDTMLYHKIVVDREMLKIMLSE